MSAEKEEIQRYLKVIESNLQVKSREPGYGGCTEEVLRGASPTMSLCLQSPTHSSSRSLQVHTPAKGLRRSKQLSLPCFQAKPSPFLKSIDQSYSDLSSGDEAPTAFPEASISPCAFSSRFNSPKQSSTASVTLPTDCDEDSKAAQSGSSLLPTSLYCPKCQLDVFTRVRTELPSFPCWQQLTCCADIQEPQFQQIRHHCQRCNTTLLAFHPH